MIITLGSVGVLLALGGPARTDEPKFGCYETFMEADEDRNGVLEVREDKGGYFPALAKRGVKPLSPTAISREEFIKACEEGVFAGLGRSGSAAVKGGPDPGSAGKSDRDLPKDLGKGDITPGAQRLPEQEARARLRANGFAEVDELKLDDQGVWRGTATVNGKRVPVAVDGQGDIVGGP